MEEFIAVNVTFSVFFLCYILCSLKEQSILYSESFIESSISENFRVQKKLAIQSKKVHYIICSDWNVLILNQIKFHLFLSFRKQILKQRKIFLVRILWLLFISFISISIFEFSSV